MKQNIKMARELVRIAKELVAFKGAGKIMETIAEHFGLSLENEDEFKMVETAKNGLILFITERSKIDKKVRDLYLDWMKNCAMNGEFNDCMEKTSRRINVKWESHPLDKIPACFEVLYNNLSGKNNKNGDKIKEINRRIKSKSISLVEMVEETYPLHEEFENENNGKQREDVLKTLDKQGKRVYSGYGYSAYLFDDISMQPLLSDLAFHSSVWCISRPGEMGERMFNNYSSKYYVVCKGNKPVNCFYEQDNKGALRFEEAERDIRYTSNNKIEGAFERDIREVYENGNKEKKKFLKVVIPDICQKLGYKLDWDL